MATRLVWLLYILVGAMVVPADAEELRGRGAFHQEVLVPSTTLGGSQGSTEEADSGSNKECGGLASLLNTCKRAKEKQTVKTERETILQPDETEGAVGGGSDKEGVSGVVVRRLHPVIIRSGVTGKGGVTWKVSNRTGFKERPVTREETSPGQTTPKISISTLRNFPKVIKKSLKSNASEKKTNSTTSDDASGRPKFGIGLKTHSGTNSNKIRTKRRFRRPLPLTSNTTALDIEDTPLNRNKFGFSVHSSTGNINEKIQNELIQDFEAVTREDTSHSTKLIQKELIGLISRNNISPKIKKTVEITTPYTRILKQSQQNVLMKHTENTSLNFIPKPNSSTEEPLVIPTPTMPSSSLRRDRRGPTAGSAFPHRYAKSFQMKVMPVLEKPIERISSSSVYFNWGTHHENAQSEREGTTLPLEDQSTQINSHTKTRKLIENRRTPAFFQTPSTRQSSDLYATLSSKPPLVQPLQLNRPFGSDPDVAFKSKVVFDQEISPSSSIISKSYKSEINNKDDAYNTKKGGIFKLDPVDIYGPHSQSQNVKIPENIEYQPVASYQTTHTIQHSDDLSNFTAEENKQYNVKSFLNFGGQFNHDLLKKDTIHSADYITENEHSLDSAKLGGKWSEQIEAHIESEKTIPNLHDGENGPFPYIQPSVIQHPIHLHSPGPENLHPVQPILNQRFNFKTDSYPYSDRQKLPSSHITDTQDNIGRNLEKSSSTNKDLENTIAFDQTPLSQTKPGKIVDMLRTIEYEPVIFHSPHNIKHEQSTETYNSGTVEKLESVLNHPSNVNHQDIVNSDGQLNHPIASPHVIESQISSFGATREHVPKPVGVNSFPLNLYTADKSYTTPQNLADDLPQAAPNHGQLVQPLLNQPFNVNPNVFLKSDGGHHKDSISHINSKNNLGNFDRSKLQINDFEPKYSFESETNFFSAPHVPKSIPQDLTQKSSTTSLKMFSDTKSAQNDLTSITETNLPHEVFSFVKQTPRKFPAVSEYSKLVHPGLVSNPISLLNLPEPKTENFGSRFSGHSPLLPNLDSSLFSLYMKHLTNLSPNPASYLSYPGFNVNIPFANK